MHACRAAVIGPNFKEPRPPERSLAASGTLKTTFCTCQMGMSMPLPSDRSMQTRSAGRSGGSTGGFRTTWTHPSLAASAETSTAALADFWPMTRWTAGPSKSALSGKTCPARTQPGSKPSRRTEASPGRRTGRWCSSRLSNRNKSEPQSSQCRSQPPRPSQRQRCGCSPRFFFYRFTTGMSTYGTRQYDAA